MKIAIISPGSFSVPPVIGSSVEHDIQMVAEQLQKEHEVIVYAKKCKEYRSSTHVGNLYHKRFRFLNYKSYLRNVSKHLSNERPDIIMVENRPSYILSIKEKFPHTPIVLNMHSSVFSKPPYVKQDKMELACCKIDAMITNSTALKEEYLSRFSTLSEKIHAVHLGIDLMPYVTIQENHENIEELRKKLGLKETDQTILFVGRLLKRKGAHLLLDVLPHLLETHPQLKLLITGSSRYGKNIQTSYVKRIKQISLKLKDHVIFTNFISPDEMPYLYQLADLVVVPSIWREPFGRVNLEAMASKKAIVASDRGGIVELIRHEENGLLFSVENYEKELTGAISRLLQSKELREAYSQKGLEMVKEFSWAKTAEQYLHIFANLLSHGEGGGDDHE